MVRKSGPGRGLIIASGVGAFGLIGCCVGGILVVLNASSTPRAKRARCARNFWRIGVGSIGYMTSQMGPRWRKGFMPHHRAMAENDGPEQVGHAFERLIRTGELDPDHLDVFVCPSSMDAPSASAADPAVFAFDDPDVRSSREFSYGWTKKQRTTGSSRSSFIMSADRTAGEDALDLLDGLRNHADGRNVLRFDCGVDFVSLEAESSDPKLIEALGHLNLAGGPGAR